jgi:enoyl-CoA hydratase/carnithine racemase
MAWMLPGLVGDANALDLLFTATMIDAAGSTEKWGW